MQPVETCEVCGLDVGTTEAVRAELAVGDMICPTAMIFHPACYEKALELWAPNPDSLCTIDREITHSGGRS